jgi:hypothetical protein
MHLLQKFGVEIYDAVVLVQQQSPISFPAALAIRDYRSLLMAAIVRIKSHLPKAGGRPIPLQ